MHRLGRLLSQFPESIDLFLVVLASVIVIVEFAIFGVNGLTVLIAILIWSAVSIANMERLVGPSSVRSASSRES